MDSRQLIDAQFDRAVEIVQGLPKTGPIQTGYEEKLTMYSLFKQATAGNVKGPRPAMWDMLGRAKWDAWAKHKDLDVYEAKWLYVDALLKVLRRYSDKTVAKDIVRELESFGGDPSNLVMSQSMSHSPGSASSGSTNSNDEPSSSRLLARESLQGSQQHGPAHLMPPAPPDDTSSSEEETDDDAPLPLPAYDPHFRRPQSSLSSHRYRTPLAGSMALSPPPAVQPHPGFETPSAFAGPSSSPTTYLAPAPAPASSSYTVPASYPTQVYRASPRAYGARPPLERAVESMQAHLAALGERLELLEITSRRVGSPGPRARAPRPGAPLWYDDLGMWTLALRPLVQAIERLQAFVLAARRENRSPTFVVVRRLFLDITFVLCVLAVVKSGWRRSGARRREVKAALVILWKAIFGSGSGTGKEGRMMVDQGV